MNSRVLAWLILTPLTFSHYADALVIRNYQPAQHDRFTNFPSAPQHNPQFIHAAFDFTGVGWNKSDTRLQYTLVSPLHFVGAYHARPGLGHTLRFLTADGTIREYKVAATSGIPNASGQNTDLFVGRLTAPIVDADGISHHAYLNLASDSDYIGKNVMFFGHPARAGRQIITQLSYSQSSTTNQTRTLRTRYSTFFGQDDDAYLQSGDSGSPVFIEHNGTAAILGTHSLVSGSSIITNHSSFIPFYADKLNETMANHGYHMTKAIPGSTSLSLTQQIPNNPIRAGHPFSILMTLENQGSNRADNIRLRNIFPADAVVHSASGTQWFDQSSTNYIEARRAELASTASTSYNIDLTIPSAGTHTHSTSHWSDQSTTTNANFTIEVIGSFLSYVTNLDNKSFDGDDDKDNISNLLEYVFGGDPNTSSVHFPNTTTPLLPKFTNTASTFQFSYFRRKNYAARAINYMLQTSTNMTDTPWEDANTLITSTTTSNINSEFERVTHNLSNTQTNRFFRLKITLSE